MSKGKKWNTPLRYIGKRSHGRKYRYHVVGGKGGKCRFQHFRHKKLFKLLYGKVSMRFIMNREIRYWD